MFKNPFSFEGRIRRAEYGISYIIYMAAVMILAFTLEGNEELLFLMILYIPMLWFLFAQGAKRCHDRGNNGGYQIIPFYVLWMWFADSMYGENEYGKNPKGQGNADELEDFASNLVN